MVFFLTPCPRRVAFVIAPSTNPEMRQRPSRRPSIERWSLLPPSMDFDKRGDFASRKRLAPLRELDNVGLRERFNGTQEVRQ